MKTFRLGLLATLVFAAFGSASVAEAQAWFQDRSQTQGPGFRVGNLEIHPGLGMEFGYDSNVFRSESDANSSAIFRVSPHVGISTLSQERRAEAGQEHSQRNVDFSAFLGAPIYLFLSDSAQHNVGVNADLGLTLFPEGTVSFTLANHFERSIRPFTEAGAEGNNYARDQNTASADLKFQSRGGIFAASFGYSFNFDLFESNSFTAANSLRHGLRQNASFRFLPNTALFQEFEANRTTYQNDSVLGLYDNWRLRTRIGLNGAITNAVSVLAAIGYGAVVGGDARLGETEALLAQAELRLRPGLGTTIKFGYDRALDGSAAGNWRLGNRIYGGLSLAIGGAFVIGLDADVNFASFGRIPGTITLSGSDEDDRSDILVSATLSGEYRFTNWLGVTASVGYSGDFSDFEYARLLGTTRAVDTPKFSKFEAWLGVRVFY